jgi:transposase
LLQIDYLKDMKFIQGQDRFQTSLFPVSLDASIDENNEVRVIDLFVDSLDLNPLGFNVDFVDNGRPAYHPKDLLKVFIYGYLNRIRSSRGLEKETKRNIEMIWLLKGLSPDHNTINNFRKNNPKAIKKVFRKTVEFARNFDLIGGLLLAGDGTKLKAQNSKKNNYNQKKIDRHVSYIDAKLEEYTAVLAEADEDDKQKIEEKIAEKEQRKAGYKQLEEQLRETGEKQISTSDPESRQLIIRGVITEVAYNVQSTVDAKHKLPIDYQVTNENDRNALSGMVEKAVDILGTNQFDVVFDKGYHNAEQLHRCHMPGVETHVAITAPSANAPEPSFNVSEFKHNVEQDTYSCPAEQTLKTNGNWYVKRVYRVKQYKTPHCKDCVLKKFCTISKSGRIIERHEFAESVERNKRAQEEHPEIYKQRQAIVEHPFGTMKRQWGYDHIMTKKTKKHASADVGFIFIAYNLRRIINIIGVNRLKELFSSICLLFTAKGQQLHPKKKYRQVKPILIEQIQEIRNLPKKRISSPFITNLLIAA